MKKQFTFAIAAMLMLASCSDSEKQVNDAVAPEGSVKALDFTTFVDQNTKGRPHEGNLLKQDFGVMAYWDKDLCRNYLNLNPNFMYKEKICYNQSNHSFTYSPIKFWPEKGCVDFFAWTPYTDDDVRWIPGSHLLTGYPAITYHVDGNCIEEQEDFMVSEALKRDGDTPCVDLNFKHALTKVGVTACLDACYDGYVIKVTEVKFEKIHDRGTFSYERYVCDVAEWWNVMPSTCDYNLCLDETDGVIIAHYEGENDSAHDYRKHRRVHREDNFLLAMPQVLENNAKLCVKYEVVKSGVTKTYEKSINLKECHQRWEPGMCIIYDLCIEKENQSISFTAHSTDWDDCIEKEIEVCL